MERKDISAILLDEFKIFLEEKNLYQDFIAGKILCSNCNISITTDNIAVIYYNDGFKFCCDKPECIKKLR